MFKLSILIPTLNERKDKLNSLLTNIYSQYGYDKGLIEVLTDPDDGQKKIGEKRNDLLQAAKGEFSVFIDDDDNIPPYYLERIISAFKENQLIDCIGIVGEYYNSGKRMGIFRHSVDTKHYYQRRSFNQFVYYRPPNHINPIRNSIARQFKFPVKNMGEDTDWAMQICRARALKKEYFIDQIMYYYFYDKSPVQINNI